MVSMNDINTSPQLGKTSLFGWNAQHQPVLKGVRCSACGAVAFPPQHYGCERCGATGLLDIELAPNGVALGAAQVHIHAQPYPKAPFTVVEVRLDEGPVVRALLDTTGQTDLAGRRVRGVLREGRQAGVLDFQFEVAA